MSYKKTIILIIILCILIGIAYLLNRPAKKSSEEIVLFPEFDSEKATTISVKGDTNKLTLSKEEGQWVVVEEDNLPADKEQVKQALQIVSELKRDNIVSKNPSKQDIYQVDPNKGFEVEIKGEEDKTLAHFYIGKNGPDFMSTYYRKADSDEVILYKGFHLRSRFDKPADTWLDKFIIIVQEQDVDRIEFNRADGPFSLIHDHEAEKWRLDSPVESDIKEKMEKDITQTLFNLRASKVQRLKPDQKLEEFGLDAPFLTLNIIMADETSKTLLIGKENEKTDEYYAKLFDRDIIYSVGKFSIDKLNKTWQELKVEEPPPEEKTEKQPSEEELSGQVNEMQNPNVPQTTP
ncbi:MAG: DUF4340 domain-containing protein [bacterium]